MDVIAYLALFVSLLAGVSLAAYLAWIGFPLSNRRPEKVNGKCPECKVVLTTLSTGEPITHICLGGTVALSWNGGTYLVPFEESTWYQAQLISCPFCETKTPKFEPYCLNCGFKPTNTAKSPFSGWIPKSSFRDKN